MVITCVCELGSLHVVTITDCAQGLTACCTAQLQEGICVHAGVCVGRACAEAEWSAGGLGSHGPGSSLTPTHTALVVRELMARVTTLSGGPCRC